MTEKKRCIRCDRPIDAAARICPYCNWDQANPNVPRAEETAAPVYVPRPERPWRRWIAMGIGGVILIIVAFALGSHVLGTAAAPPTATTDTAKTSSGNAGPVKPAPRPDITLVPTSDTSGAAPPAEAPITSAPAATASTGTAAETDRTDATAVSSAEYAQLAARAQAEKKKAQPMVDPRTLTGPAYQQGQQAKAQPPQPQPQQQPQISSSTTESAPPPEPARAVTRTSAEPEYQPMPDVDVNETTTVRLNLTVGADGHVKEVDVSGGGIEGQTGKIISTVQTWRFKPATENGVPVQSTFSTALSFHGRQ